MPGLNCTFYPKIFKYRGITLAAEQSQEVHSPLSSTQSWNKVLLAWESLKQATQGSLHCFSTSSFFRSHHGQTVGSTESAS